MRALGVAGVLVLAAGVTGLGFEPAGEQAHSSADAGPTSGYPEAGAAADVKARDPFGSGVSPRPGVTPAAVPPPQTVPQVRRSRSRGSGRYPGPIPTPAEWKPPEGPVRIALQAGHWKAEEAPRELSGLRDNGTAWRGTAEWEVNLAIAEKTSELLKEHGYEVDILPAVVPPSYRAHLFIAIHADGSNDPNATGYRVASPRRDATGRAARFAALLKKSYGDATSIRSLPTVTHRMQNYYAFNYRRYEHALHPMTIGVILETGFITSAKDRLVIVSEPEKAARGIVDAIVAFPETPPPADSAQAAKDSVQAARDTTGVPTLLHHLPPGALGGVF